MSQKLQKPVWLLGPRPHLKVSHCATHSAICFTHRLPNAHNYY